MNSIWFAPRVEEASAISYGKNMEVYEEAIELLHG